MLLGYIKKIIFTDTSSFHEFTCQYPQPNLKWTIKSPGKLKSSIKTAMIYVDYRKPIIDE